MPYILERAALVMKYLLFPSTQQFFTRYRNECILLKNSCVDGNNKYFMYTTQQDATQKDCPGKSPIPLPRLLYRD
jgi:hypothetical protein